VSVRMTLRDFLNRVEGVYKSVDIRIAAVKTDDIWQNALTVVRLSCRDKEELKEYQSQLQKTLGRVETGKFIINMQSWPLESLDVLVGMLSSDKSMWLLFNGSPAELHFERSIDLLDLEGDFQAYGMTRRERPAWPTFEAIAGEHCRTIDETRVQGEVKSATGLDLYSLIRELFEMNFTPNTAFSFLVAAPFYAVIEDEAMDFEGQMCRVRVKFHRNIKSLSVTAVAYTGDHESAPLRDKDRSIMSLEESEKQDEDFRLWTKRLSLPKARRNDYLSVTLMQTEPPSLDLASRSMQISRLLASKEPAKNPLLAAFREFCPEDRLESYVTKPGETRPPAPKDPSSAFEGYVSWILGLCGFQSVWLGWTEHETLREGKIEHLRLDILAYYQKEDTLLLVACTLGSPNQDIDIVNSVKEKLYTEVFKGTSIQIRGFVFSSQPRVDVAKQLGKQAGVTVFGSEDLRGILDYVRRGEIARALSDFFGFPFKSDMGV